MSFGSTGVSDQVRLIIAGSRDVTDYSVMDCAFHNSPWSMDDVTQVVSGTARGVDRLGEEWARRNNKEIQRFPAQWGVHGKSAGYRRNEDMARHADALLAIWDGKSRGTKHMIDIAKRKGLEVYVWIEE